MKATKNATENPYLRGYLISRFNTTHEIRENQMHAKSWCITVAMTVINYSIIWEDSPVSFCKQMKSR